MLTSRGEVKLVDLGIAKRLDEERRSRRRAVGRDAALHLPGADPGAKDIDARADIYSLGATLYHLVTGHTPFAGSSGALVMSMHLIEPLPDPRRYEPALSEGMCRVLRKMMAKKREERYPDVYALDVDLFRLQCGEMPQPDEQAGAAAQGGTRGTGSRTPLRPSSRRRRARSTRAS